MALGQDLAAGAGGVPYNQSGPLMALAEGLAAGGSSTGGDATVLTLGRGRLDANPDSQDGASPYGEQDPSAAAVESML